MISSTVHTDQWRVLSHALNTNYILLEKTCKMMFNLWIVNVTVENLQTIINERTNPKLEVGKLGK